MLKRRDAENNYIKFVDIADPAYQPGENAGVTFEQVCTDPDRRARPDVIIDLEPAGRSVSRPARRRAGRRVTGLDTTFVCQARFP